MNQTRLGTSRFGLALHKTPVDLSLKVSANLNTYFYLVSPYLPCNKLGIKKKIKEMIFHFQSLLQKRITGFKVFSIQLYISLVAVSLIYFNYAWITIIKHSREYISRYKYSCNNFSLADFTGSRELTSWDFTNKGYNLAESSV